MSAVEDYAVRATDGAIGRVKDFYFDDGEWVIRYLVVNTSTWLLSWKVLISPISIGEPNWSERILPVLITKEQVKKSPDIDTEKPVSRQHEVQYFGYYGYPFYRGGAGLWGGRMYPNMMMPGYGGLPSTAYANQTESGEANARAEAARQQPEDPHLLRSCKAVMGYHIDATDGDIGRVQGLLVDEETWAIRYLIVNTSKWWLGHEVFISPQLIKDVDWPDSTVTVKLTRHAVKHAPPYDSAALPDPKQETGILGHYGHPGYWAGEAKHAAVKSRDKLHVGSKS